MSDTICNELENVLERFLTAYEREMGPVDRFRLQENVSLWFLRGALAALVFAADLADRWKSCSHTKTP